MYGLAVMCICLFISEAFHYSPISLRFSRSLVRTRTCLPCEPTSATNDASQPHVIEVGDILPDEAHPSRAEEVAKMWSEKVTLTLTLTLTRTRALTLTLTLTLDCPR